MQRTTKLAGLAFGIESGCEGDCVWIAFDDGAESGLRLIDALVICLITLAGVIASTLPVMS